MRFAKNANALPGLKCCSFILQLVTIRAIKRLSRDFFNRLRKKLHPGAVVFFDEQFLFIRTIRFDW
jgi:hypothetical protein